MKKHLIIFLLALLPFVASAQTDTTRTLKFYGYNGLSLGSMTLTTNTAGTLLYNGQPLTAAQQALVDAAVKNSPAAITSNGVYNSLRLQNIALKFSIDSLSGVLTALTKSTAGDTTRAIIPNYGIDTANTFLNQQIVRKSTAIAQSVLNGTYFAPTAIALGAPTVNSIPFTLTIVPGATSYQIWTSTTSASTGFKLITNNAQLSDVLVGLNPSTQYWVQAKASNGSNYSMGVVVTATTISPPPANSIASAGYTVVDYFNAQDETVSTNNNKTAIVSTNVILRGSGTSISNGIATLSDNPFNIIPVNGFLTGHYKITFYGASVDSNVGMYNGNVGVGPTVAGTTTTLEIDMSAGGYLDFYTNGKPVTFSEFKIEKQN